MSETLNPQAETLKEQGNAAFKAGDFAGAIKAFTEAIALSPIAEYYSNRSAAYLKAGENDKALEDGEKCVSLKADWGKGYARKAAALLALKEWAKAVACYTAGVAQEPSNEILTNGLKLAEQALANGGLDAAKKKKKNKKKKATKETEKIDAGADASADGNYVIGIDLGTTYSCVGVWVGDNVQILENDDGEKTIPSYVAFDQETGQRVVGQAAKNQSSRNAGNTIYDIKRIIGQRFADRGVEDDISKFHFKVQSGADDKPQVCVKVGAEEKTFAPEEISAMVLVKCKQLAEKRLGVPVTRAVVTVPAYFNDAQRNATKAAGAIAGLDVLRIINEPTAAALSYGLDNVIEAGKNLNVLIFDLGGGTFDVSILSIEGGIFTVKATGGDTRLGGEDFDNNLVDFLVAEADKQGFSNIRDNGRVMQRLKRAAEICKRELSLSQSADIRLDDLLNNKNFVLKVPRAKFEALNKAPFTLCIDTVKRVLKDAKMKIGDIDEIVLVGGSTRIPKLQEMLSGHFGGKSLCKTLNPDEAVAYGAAVQGAILSGSRNSKTSSLLLMDVTPLSLGIETTGRVMSVVIPRNTPIPCVKTQVYTTDANYQTKVDVSVYEGERLKSDENNLLGEFTISGIESAKRGEPQIDVSFSIDSNGILTVTAKDQKTGATADISITNRSRATTAEIDQMVKEANEYRLEDEERLRKFEAKNDLEHMIFEVMDAARDDKTDKKVAEILMAAAEKEQSWLAENGETAKAAEIALRRRGLARRLKQ